MLIHSCSKCKIFSSLWTTNWKNTRAWVLWHCDLGVVRLNGNITRLCFTRSFLDQNKRHEKALQVWTYPSSDVSCQEAITPGKFLGLALQLSGTYQTFERFFCSKGGSFSKDVPSMFYFAWKQRNPWRLHQGKYLMNRNSTYCRSKNLLPPNDPMKSLGVSENFIFQWFYLVDFKHFPQRWVGPWKH